MHAVARCLRPVGVVVACGWPRRGV